jgi:hypothetical protein
MTKLIELPRMNAAAAKKRPSTTIADIDQELAIDAELSARVADNRGRVRDQLRARNSKKTWKAPARDELADRDIMMEIQRAILRGATVRLTGKKRAGVIWRRVPIHVNEWAVIDKEYRDAKRRHGPDLSSWIATFWVPLWAHTGDRLKALAWSMMMSETQARSITLRLGPEIIARGRNHKRGFAAYMQGQIQKNLKAEFDKVGEPTPEFFIILEDTELGEVHVHGAVVEPGHPRSHAAIRRALLAAGGNWVGPSGVRSGRQLDSPKLETAFRWVSYALKWGFQSSERLGGPIVAASNGLRKRSRAWFNAARRNGFTIKPDRAWHDHGDLLAAYRRENTAGPGL